MPPAGFRPRSPRKLTAADPRLRPRGHRDRPMEEILNNIMFRVTIFREVDNFGVIGLEGNVKVGQYEPSGILYSTLESLCVTRNEE